MTKTKITAMMSVMTSTEPKLIINSDTYYNTVNEFILYSYNIYVFHAIDKSWCHFFITYLDHTSCKDDDENCLLGTNYIHAAKVIISKRPVEMYLYVSGVQAS